MILPYPPTANTYYRNVGGRMMLSKRGREYRNAVSNAGDMVRMTAGREPTTARLKMLIRVYPPDRRRRDMDNLIKPLWDAMQHAGLYADDEQIDDYRVIRGDIKRPGRVEVTISELDWSNNGAVQTTG